MFRTWLCIVALLVLGSGVVLARDEPAVGARLGEEQIYFGETVLYQVTVENVESPAPPTLEGFAAFDVAALGDKSLNSRSIRVINGRATEAVTFGHAWIYRLTPRSAGTLVVPPPSAVVDGKVLTGPALKLRVVAPEEQDVVLLELSTDREHAYPLVPFTISLRVLVRALPAPLESRNPFSVQEDPPALTLPWVEAPAGLQATLSAEEWLTPLTGSEGSGFTINDLRVGTSFSFFDRGATVFQPKLKKVTRVGKDGGEIPYFEATLVRTFVGLKPGHYGFGPVALKGTFATGYDTKRKRATGQSIFALGKAIAVEVQPPPEAGRPECWTGAVGQFEWHGELTPTRARVGDPMTLTLTLRGQGTLDQTTAPDLARIPEIDAAFRIYEATAETRERARIFTWSLRPRQAGVTAFPAVPIAVFDVEKARYVTLLTKPIALEIAEADRMTAADVVSGGDPSGRSARDVSARQEGIFGDIADLSAVRNDVVHPHRTLAWLLFLAALWGAAGVAIRRYRRRTGDPARVRRASAAAAARARVRVALDRLQVGDVRAGAESARAAITGLVADVLNIDAAGLTPRETAQQLTVLVADAELAGRCRALLEAGDAIRYGAGAAPAATLVAELPSLIDAVIQSLSQRGRLS